jgi:hypothetical protein
MARVRFLDQVPVGFYDVNNSNGGTPGGPSNSIQYNDGGTFNGDINLRWDNNTDTVLLTGSIIATSFTGSLFGTSSFALSSSQAQTASYVLNAISASQARTASYVNPLNQDVIITGSLSNGINVNAIGLYSHAEGNNTFANGTYSHAEGQNTIARGAYSHAEGGGTVASGTYSHAEGQNTIAQGESSHAEGIGTITSASYQHAQGMYNITSSISGAFMLGNGTSLNRSNLIFAAGNQVQITGSLNVSGSITGSLFGTSSFAVSASQAQTASYVNPLNQNVIITGSLNSGLDNITSGLYSHAEGSNTVTYGTASHAEGEITVTYGIASHAEGSGTTTYGRASHAEGISNIASGSYSHAEGATTKTYGTASHAEGSQTTTYGIASHAEGLLTIAQGIASHAEGYLTTASGDYSHTEGYNTITYGEASHAEGIGTIASASYQHAQGMYNITSSIPGAFILGNGTSDVNRSNLIFAAENQVQITGSLNTSGSVFFRTLVTSSTAVSNVVMYGTNGQLFITASSAIGGGGGISGDYVTTASFNAYTGSSTSQFAGTASFATTASFVISASYALSSSQAQTASYVVTAQTASYVLSASYALSSSQAQTASYVVTAQTASFVLSASYALSSSQATTASYVVTAQTASYVLNAVSASYALSSSQAATASYVVTAQTASYVLSASYALSSSQAQTASYILNAVSASYASNGGVTQLLAGPNVTLSPTNGLGQVTISSTSGGGGFNTATGSYGSFYSTQTQTNVAGTARSMSLNITDITNGVSISGSTDPFNTYIKTQNAGVYDIQFSAQVDKTDSGTDEIWIWLRKNGTDISDSATSIQLVGNGAHYVAAWNFFVNAAANDYFQLMWYSPDANVRLHAESAFGVVPGIPSLIVTANRVDQFLSNTGSFSGSFIGSLSGTASFATSASFAQTASYVVTAQTASYVLNAQTASYVVTAQTASYVLSASYALSSSQAQTSSFALTASTTPQLYRIINNTDSATITGSTALTLLYSQLIPANTFAVNDVIRLSSRGLKTGVTSGSALNHYINTSNTISGATLLASYAPGATFRMLQNDRKLYIKNITGNTEVYATTVSSYLDFQPTGTQVFGNIAINWTVDQYIIFGGQLFGSADSFKGLSYEIERIRTT